jgi:predicted acyl esterase
LDAVGRRVIVACCAGVLALVATGRAAAFGKAEVTLHMDDGVGLAATLYEPSAPPPYPAIVLFHSLGGKRQDLDFIAQRWADTFAVLSVDARGHGQSGGLVSIDGPREIADTRAIYDWLAARSEIGDRAIGAWGISLGGGAVLRSLVEGVPWNAVEAVQTWTDLYSALAPQNLSKSGVVYQFLSSVPQDRLDPSVLALKDDALASRNLDRLRQFASERSSRSRLSQVTTPVYLFQGRRDFAFDIGQATAGYRLLKGHKRLYVGDFGHAPSTFPGPDVNAVLYDGESWFFRWLVRPPQRPIRYPVTIAPDPWHGKALRLKRVPATRNLRLTFRGRTSLEAREKSVRTSRRLATRTETFGSARVRLTARLSGGWSRVVAVLTARPRHGKAIVVSEGGVNTSSLRGTHRLTIRLLDDATLIPPGSRLILTLASSSAAQDPGNLLYLDLPMPPKARVVLGPAQLVLPVLQKPVSR